LARPLFPCRHSPGCKARRRCARREGHRRHRRVGRQDRSEQLDLGHAGQPGFHRQLHPAQPGRSAARDPRPERAGHGGPGRQFEHRRARIPVSTGGSEYVGLQEDGLPVTLFGDIAFGNNDYWIRFDNNVDKVEAVRGGSASTFSSQAPGAVINYVSKTGTQDGGSVGLSQAINYRETRVDFDYGGHLSDSVRFHVGGYVVDGNGPTHLPYTAEKGYQIKANITKELADGKGYIRLNFKRLDDQEPTYTSMPALATLSGNKITGFSMIPGVDPRVYASTGIYNQTFRVLAANGTLQTVQMQGIHPVVTSVGGEFHYEFAHNITVTDKFRWTDMSGSFSNQWTGEATTASIAGTGTLRYADGPLKGRSIPAPSSRTARRPMSA
jgi:outer membrane receptor protein involved in Fe transport